MDIQSLQCTVLDYGLHASAVSEFQSLISGWDCHRDHFLEQLVHLKIPKSSSVVIPIPETSRVVCVSITPSLVADRSICRNKFWRIQFSCKVYDAGSPPKVCHEEWVRENKREGLSKL